MDEPDIRGRRAYSLLECITYLKLYIWGFGSPVALVWHMQRDLAENKKWLREEEYKEGLAKYVSIKAFVEGITAAVIGALVGSVIVIGMRSITDFPTAVIAIAAVLALLYAKKIQETCIIGITAIIGILIKTL